MKLGQLSRPIDAYSDGLEAAAAGLGSGLRVITSFLNEFANEQMSNLVKRGSKIALPNAAMSCQGGDAGGTGVSTHLDHLAKVLAAGGAKAECIKDVAHLSKLLRGLNESETLSTALDKLRDAMQPEPVEQQIVRFIERLKIDSRTPAFEATFAELAASPLKREHVVAVAMSVYGSIKKGTSRKGALDYIRKPHDAFMSTKRGIDATGGRSAA